MPEVKTLFRRTMHVKEVLAKARHNPIQTFEDCPLFDVRQACLNSISFINEERAEWIESFLLEAEGGGSGNRDPLGAEALAWYVAEAPNQLGARAIEFAIRRRGAWRNQFVSKIVSGRIRKDPWLWKGIPNLQDFLEECMSFLWSDEHSNVYAEEWWITTERALRLVAFAQEVRLKPMVNKIFVALRNNNLTPWGTPGSAEHHLRLAEHKALLQETLRILRLM